MVFSTAWGGRRILIIGLLISICWALLSPSIVYLARQQFRWVNKQFRWVNNKVYDRKLYLFAKRKLNPPIVHLDIDDESIKRSGEQWPWDRAISARIVEKLTEFGAKTIVFDIMYASKGRSTRGDEALAKAIEASGRVVLAEGLFESEPSASGSEPQDGASKEESALKRAWRLAVPRGFDFLSVRAPRDSSIPLFSFIEGAKELGHINSTPDEDGIHRRIRLFIRVGDRLVPSLSLAALVSYLNADPKRIVIAQDGQIEIHHPGGIMRIPVDSQGRMLINWPSPVWDSFENYPAWDVLDEEKDPSRMERYKDNIVIISIAWTGNTDMGASPVEDEVVLLSRIHSSALDTMLTGRFIREVSPLPVVGIAVSVLVSLAFLPLGVKLRYFYAVILCLILYALYAASLTLALVWASLDIPVAESSFIFLPGAAVCLIFRAISTEKDRRQIRDTFGRYLSDDVVTEILKSPGGINLTGELRDVTILVSDLRGSTPMGEALEPPQVLRVINRYLDRMVAVIMRHEGTIDEFTGDGILVFFGAPRAMSDAAKRAVLCAVDMQKAMPELNRENVALGLPELRMGIGINRGQLVVGNIGSEQRKKYGAIGSAINVAFRVEAQTDRAGGEILITQSVCDRIDGPLELGPPRTVSLKGIAEPMRLYPVIGIPEDYGPPSR
ncbi:MAG: CHASE2 domain-containing protein [Desulfomonilaceae bacterium]